MVEDEIILIGLDDPWNWHPVLSCFFSFRPPPLKQNHHLQSSCNNNQHRRITSKPRQIIIDTLDTAKINQRRGNRTRARRSWVCYVWFNPSYWDPLRPFWERTDRKYWTSQPRTKKCKTFPVCPTTSEDCPRIRTIRPPVPPVTVGNHNITVYIPRNTKVDQINQSTQPSRVPCPCSRKGIILRTTQLYFRKSLNS